MCTDVTIIRDGALPMQCSTVRELARWFLAPVQPLFADSPVGPMAEHCLCPVDIEGWGKASGYSMEWYDDEWLATRTNGATAMADWPTLEEEVEMNRAEVAELEEDLVRARESLRWSERELERIKTNPETST